MRKIKSLVLLVVIVLHTVALTGFAAIRNDMCLELNEAIKTHLRDIDLIQLRELPHEYTIYSRATLEDDFCPETVIVVKNLRALM